MKKTSLFAQLFLVFFGAGVAIVLAIYFSFYYLADRPYQKSFYQNIVNYTLLIADKIRFDPMARLKIEAHSGIKIYSTPMQMRRLRQNKKLQFVTISPFVSVTKPKAIFYVKYDDGFETFIIRIKDQNYYPEKIDAIIVALVISLFVILLTYLKIQNIFGPLKKIQKYTVKFGDGHFEDEIPISSEGQLGELTESINLMARRIKNMLDAKRDLLLAIGHEIKTPLTRLRLQAEMSPECNESMIRNINEISEIVTGILEAERVADHRNLNLEPVDLVGFLKKYEKDDISLNTDLATLLTEVDPVRLDLACKNVINNSLKYAKGAPINIYLSKDADKIKIRFVDQGGGVPEDKQRKLTEAFYRPDDSRSRMEGGVGLGLHLVDNIIRAHQGELRFKNLSPGFEVEFTLPYQKTS